MNHHEQRYVEASECGVDLIEEILADDAVRWTGLGVGVLVPHDQQRWQTDACRSQPNETHVNDHTSRCSFHPVLQRLGYGTEPATAKQKTLLSGNIRWLRHCFNLGYFRLYLGF